MITRTAARAGSPVICRSASVDQRDPNHGALPRPPGLLLPHSQHRQAANPHRLSHRRGRHQPGDRDQRTAEAALLIAGMFAMGGIALV